jgi:membrane-associated phospholipid phosphatase
LARLRSSEWLIVAYFAYVALISPWFIAAWKAWVMAGIVAALVWALSRRDSVLRDCAPLAFVITAYRQMDWFTPAVREHRLETAWVVWDRWLLDNAHLREAIESAGALLPSYLELCYLLVYAVGPVSIAALFLNGRRERMNQFWLGYLAGTLGAYALFPYFPSEPPRTAFAGSDLPNIVTFLRRFNLWIVGGYGIHSSVFPSAHVSSALSAAWGLLSTLPERRWIGWLMAFYGLSVAVAAIHGRYHYAVDAAAGLVVSLAGLLAVRQYARRRSAS